MMSITQPTKNDLPRILNNFSLEILFSLARLDLGLLDAKEHHTTTCAVRNPPRNNCSEWFLEKYFQISIKNTSKEQNDLILLA
jgi:hypothetical protein